MLRGRHLTLKGKNMAKNDQDSVEDIQDKKARLEIEVKAKAAAYAKQQADDAARVAEEAKADVKAKRDAAEKEAVDDPNLVKMKKGDDVLQVHASAVAGHAAVGWEIC
jgi:hypothetical protein